MSFLSRLILLIAILALIALIDWRRNSSRATKWREYGFLATSGLIGGLFGVAIDHVTATISRDYFVIGKGIAADDGFRLNVTAQGFQAGLAAGAVIGGIYLLANNPKPLRETLPYARLLRFGLWPILCALLFAPLMSLLMYLWDPFHFSTRLDDLLPQSQREAFLAVWGVHVGLYLGGLTGTVGGVIGIRRARSFVDRSD
jgi:hypothetical protein